MKKYARFLRFAVPVGLSACLCTATAQADDPTARITPIHPKPQLLQIGAGATATVRADVLADTWVTPGTLRPKYKVEALSFHCNDEVGYDGPWISDEVRVGIGTPATTTISKVFGDVDSGESRSFAPDQSCIYPIDGQSPSGNSVFTPSEAWSCSDAGTPGPISFKVVMVEEDSGFFHSCFSDGPFGGCSFYSDERLPDPNDELIGRRTLEFTAEELAAAMPNVGDTFEETITLGPHIDEWGNERSPTPIPADPAEYTFTYRFTRLGPVLSNRPGLAFGQAATFGAGLTVGREAG